MSHMTCHDDDGIAMSVAGLAYVYYFEVSEALTYTITPV